MTLKELRLGNWVRITDYYNTPINVEARGKYHQFTFSDAKIIQYLEPIPLSEELLLKCGFEKNKTRDDKGVYPFFRKSNFRCRLMLGVLSLKEYKDRHQDIKYLHQLQNIYFSLVGEELEVNL